MTWRKEGRIRVTTLLFCSFFSLLLFFPGALPADNPQFGLNTNNFPCENTDGDAGTSLFNGLNIKWIRAGMKWYEIEQVEGVYTFFEPHGPDRIVKYAQQHGINIVFGLDQNPAFYGSFGDGNWYVPAEHTANWIAFVTAMVKRYDGIDDPNISEDDDMPGLTKPIKYWSIWNEPNLTQFWRVPIVAPNHAEEFVNNILIPGIAAIRAADPSAKICGPDLSSVDNCQSWFDYITGRLNAIGEKFDVLTHHQYHGEDDPDLRFYELRDFHNHADASGYSGKPFWITETGWPVDGSQGDSSLQMTKMLTHMQNNSVWWDKTFWFAWRDSQDIYPMIDYQTDIPYPQYWTFKSFTNPPFLTITYPNGGEYWAPGSTNTIRWISNSITPVTNIMIHLLRGTTSVTTITESTLAENGEYIWTVPDNQPIAANYKIRIINIDNSQVFDYSNANFSIAVSSSPGQTILSAPGDGDLSCSNTPEFKWKSLSATPPVIDYQLRIKYANGDPFKTWSNLKSLSFTPTANPLPRDNSYLWSVRARNSIGYGIWSNERRVDIMKLGPPLQPSLIYPSGGSTITSPTPTLKWSAPIACPAIDYYDIQLNTADGSDGWVFEHITSTTYKVPAYHLESGKWYEWLVRAHNALGWGAWSARRTFKVQLP